MLNMGVCLRSSISRPARPVVHPESIDEHCACQYMAVSGAELVVSLLLCRGAFPSSVYLELYIDGSFVTAAEADGLIIATPRWGGGDEEWRRTRPPLHNLPLLWCGLLGCITKCVCIRTGSPGKERSPSKCVKLTALIGLPGPPTLPSPALVAQQCIILSVATQTPAAVLQANACLNDRYQFWSTRAVVAQSLNRMMPAMLCCVVLCCVVWLCVAVGPRHTPCLLVAPWWLPVCRARSSRPCRHTACPSGHSSYQVSVRPHTQLVNTHMNMLQIYALWPNTGHFAQTGLVLEVVPYMLYGCSCHSCTGML